MPQVFHDCSGWGNHISWTSWPKKLVYGHHTPTPGVGRLAADISSTSVAKTNNQKDGDYARVFKHDVSNSSVQTVLRKRW